MNPIYRVAAGLLAATLAGGAAAQFNTDAMKKMQKEGLERLEEQKTADTPKAAAPGKESAARRAYRSGKNLCLDARGALSVELCKGKAASQQWALDGERQFVAWNGRCLAGDSLVKCSQGRRQQWTYDKRGRLRNDAGQCLQPSGTKAGARVTAAACSNAPAQVWQ